VGSAEDEYGDGGARFAKIRPMRVEMYFIHSNRWNLRRSSKWRRTAVASLQRLKLLKMNEMHCSGQRGVYQIGDDMRRP